MGAGGTEIDQKDQKSVNSNKNGKIVESTNANQNNTNKNTSENSNKGGKIAESTNANQNNTNKNTNEYIDKGGTIEIKTEEFQNLLAERDSLKERVKELEIKNAENESLKKRIKELEEIIKKYEEQGKNDKNKAVAETNEEKLQKIIKRQTEMRAQDNLSKKRSLKNKVNDESTAIKQTLEDMCTLGAITKEKIIEEKKNNPEKFIEIKDAANENNKSNGLFCLGILGSNLESLGITTAIERSISNIKFQQDFANTFLQFIMNGYIEKKKYIFHFDFGDEYNDKLLTDMTEQKTFNKKLAKKLSKDFGIPEIEIIITCPQKGSYKVQVIFETGEFNYFNKNAFMNKFNKSNEYKELCHLKDIQEELIMDGCRLYQNMLDSRGNRESGWGINEKRGGEPYIPPLGWIGYGLNVYGKYDSGNNNWLGMDGNPEEWCVAYHGIGTGGGVSVPQATNLIYSGGFKAGGRQAKANEDDTRHPGKKVGNGVYCSPSPKVMDAYAKVTNLNGKKYKLGFMMRVKPDKVRQSSSNPDYWVLEGTTDEMRPYRIMVKEVTGP